MSLFDFVFPRPDFLPDDDSPAKRRRQALRALIIAQARKLARTPDDAAAVAALDLLQHLGHQLAVSDVGTAALRLDDWWNSGTEGNGDYVQMLQVKSRAIDLLHDLFASLQRLGVTIPDDFGRP